MSTEHAPVLLIYSPQKTAEPKGFSTRFTCHTTLTRVHSGKKKITFILKYYHFQTSSIAQSYWKEVEFKKKLKSGIFQARSLDKILTIAAGPVSFPPGLLCCKSNTYSE